MLSKEVREALDAELDHLRIKKRKLTAKIDARIQAIEAVLSPEDDYITGNGQLALWRCQDLGRYT